MQARNTTDARATPASELLPNFERRHTIHTPETGRKSSREVLRTAAAPHSSPNSAQGKRRKCSVRRSGSGCAAAENAREDSQSSITSVSQKSRVSKNAAMLVSQTQRVAQAMIGG